MFSDNYHYSQPDFYHFTNDSLELVKIAIETLEDNNQQNLIGLDLFSGCGIVGIETLLKCHHYFDQFYFCEIQQDYKVHLEENIRKILGNRMKIESYFKNFKELPTKKYDFIICNPPYFKQGAGRRPLSIKRELCRFQIGFNWDDLFDFFKKSLAPNGVAILSMPIEVSRDDFVLIKKFSRMSIVTFQS